MSYPSSLQRRLFLFLLCKTEIAGVAKCLAIDYSGVAAVFTILVVLYGRVERLCLLEALAANWGLKREAGEKPFSALGAL
jgi:hypothetical protein